MKSFKYILFLLLIAVIGTSIYVAIQPNTFEVSRTRTILAPASVIYNNVIDFKNWKDWSSWVEANPEMKLIYPKQTSGINSSYSWEDDSGQGSITTLETLPNATIYQEMQIADFPASKINWVFNPNNDGSTNVTWSIYGSDLPFGFKAYTAFTGSMEEQLGPHYERSLEKLDSIVLASMEVYSIKINGITSYAGEHFLYNSTTCEISEFEDKMQDMFNQIMSYTKEHNISMSGAPFVNYTQWDEVNNTAEFSCCVPITEELTPKSSNILIGNIEPFRALKTTLKGDYRNLKEAWETALKYIPDTGLEFAEDGPMLEVYITNPDNNLNPADWITEIYIAIKEEPLNAF
ncbi:GyrI-like domain-containing protein [Aestuariibaculum sp. YM273]|uniref:SRPBCC family protein n=1 Tax=Aestuariibaculum sp. YM273 TaxID=3070659 RepID=UPI0027DAE295|nr:GyrI-like domain-containing protein [Aestuariibaculum sp. YM273]WMI65665.1 GyrI-like domain-containing protein [Aestuariibaculum sp. YM273]